MSDLARMSPQEIDQKLSELYQQEQRAEQNLAVAYNGLHYALHERQVRRFGKRATWPTTDDEAQAQVEFIVTQADYREVPWGNSPMKALEAVDNARAALGTNQEAQRVYHTEFQRRGGWSRFFVVQAGHIHSSMNCQTCNNGRTPTRFGWNPELSGLTEADAVAKLGPSLCTVCFPSAPVEWTVGHRQTAEEAAVAGMCVNRDGVNYRHHGNSTSGDCEVCGARGVTATTGGLRKHPHARQATAAERAARLTDPKLIGTPAGEVLKVDGETYKTVRSAEIAYVDAMTWTSNRQRANAAVLIEALAAKRGTTVEEATAALAKRVEKKRAEYGC